MQYKGFKDLVPSGETLAYGDKVISCSDLDKVRKVWGTSYAKYTTKYGSGGANFVFMVAMSDVYLTGYVQGVRNERRKRKK